MTSKVFVRLFGLFVVLLVLYTLVIELAFHGFVEHSSGATLRVLGREAFWAGLIALGVAIPLAASSAATTCSTPYGATRVL